MRVGDFHYDLPEELIAQYPPAERGASRMLVMHREQQTASREKAAAGCEPQRADDGGPALAGWTLRDAWFRDLPHFLRPGDLLVVNDSRVIPARLFARRAAKGIGGRSQLPTGQIEVLLTERAAEESANLWRALVKPGRKVRMGERLEFFDANEMDGSSPASLRDAVHPPALTAEVIAAGEFGERTLRFGPVADFHAVLARIGHMPLPPYIRHGQDAPEDRERYQTVYAHQPGSAAAPTAGLHFTPQTLDALRMRGVEIASLTLHVGLGTFQPVRVERVEHIRLHSESYTLPAQTAEALQRALREGRRVIAIGTTTTRTLEHVAREAGADLLPPERSSHGAPDSGWIDRIAPHSGATAIFIAPGHRFRVVSGLLTNFHLPQSTLLMLVSAFATHRMAQTPASQTSAAANPNPDSGRLAVLAAYAHAVRQRYRFYSYGDCMVML